jgi:SAM-dependent methyltransferase
VRLDNPLVVQWEYASEERLARRNQTYRELTEGESPEDVAFRAVASQKPRRLLEIGCGVGQFAERLHRELGIEVVAIDVSERMVELTRARGLETQVADAQELPFADGEFDCVVANWVLYHVPDIDRALAEAKRVLEPGGSIVAATIGERNMGELWDLLGVPSTHGLSFGHENGQEILERQFAHVRRYDAIGTVVFPDTTAMREFVAATITRAHLADRVPALTEPFRTRCAHVILTGEKANA